MLSPHTSRHRSGEHLNTDTECCDVICKSAATIAPRTDTHRERKIQLGSRDQDQGADSDDDKKWLVDISWSWKDML